MHLEGRGQDYAWYAGRPVEQLWQYHQKQWRQRDKHNKDLFFVFFVFFYSLGATWWKYWTAERRTRTHSHSKVHSTARRKNTTIKTKKEQSLYVKMLAINRLISLNFIFDTLLYRWSVNYNTSTEQSSWGRATQHVDSCKQRKESSRWRDPCFIHTSNLHTHMISDHAEDPECAYTRRRVIMNTVHLSLFPPHEISHTLSHSNSQKGAQRCTQSLGIHGGGMWFCSVGDRDENWESCDWWQPIPPRYGRRSAYPPAAARTRPWFWLRRP